jgi:L-ribulokinase
MAIVAGIDFGTQSVRVSLVDSQRGRLASVAAPYPVLRLEHDPDAAMQRHEDHVAGLIAAMKAAIAAAKVDGAMIEALAVATTGSTVVPVDDHLQPLDHYYLWCDHRAQKEAAEITAAAQQEKLEALKWYGGVYSPEMALPKVLHWLRHNPEKRRRFVTALEHCDLIVAMLTGVTESQHVVRSVCAAGHKWLWNEAAGGLPSDAFFQSIDPLFANFRSQVGENFATANKIAGRLCPEWAARLGLRAGIPIPVSALDAHCDAIGAGISEGDVVNVVGTSTCVMAIVRDTQPIEGVFGIVPGSIHPHFRGIEAGISAAGDIFEAIARRAKSDLMELSRGLEAYRAGQTGLLRLVWDNGDRNVLSNAALSGATLGWRLHHTARDELFAAIEGTAFHTRIILERLTENGVPVHRVINGGGIPQKNRVLNQVYANVFNKPVLVPKSEITSLGSAIFAFLAAGIYPSVEAAQAALTPGYDVVHPVPSDAAVYDRMYPVYRDLYFEWGRKSSHFGGAGGVCEQLSHLARG